jgi:hypothetical protein
VSLNPTREVLSNGVAMLVKSTSTTPAVTLHANIHAGTVFDPPAQPGLAHFVSRVIDRGTVHRSADDIAAELDSGGVGLTVSVNRHVMSLVWTCMVEDFDRMLSLVGEIITAPAFAADQVEGRRPGILTQIGQDEDNPASVAAEGLMALLYGDEHPYAAGRAAPPTAFAPSMPPRSPRSIAGTSPLRPCRWRWSATWRCPALSTRPPACSAPGRRPPRRHSSCRLRPRPRHGARASCR